MRTPKDINVVSVLITSDGVPKFDYLGRVLPDGTVALPATVAIVEPDKPDAQIRIRVIAFQEQKARVLRDVLTTVPHQQTSLLRLPLNFLDDGSGNGTIPTNLVPLGRGGAPEGITTFQPTDIVSSCDFDHKHETSINGTCGEARVDSATLPAFEAEAVYGDAGLQASGAPAECFDVARCFATAAPAVAVDMQNCTVQVPNGLDPSSLNLALVTPQTGECLAPGQCYVPLDSDPNGGSYSVAGGVIKMVHGVCTKLAAGAQLYVSSDCPTMAPSSPVCEPTTAAAVDASTYLDSAPAEAGSPCDGSYVITCVPIDASCGPGGTGGSAGITVSGTQAMLEIPSQGGVAESIQGTVDPATCMATFMPPPDDSGASDSGGRCDNKVTMVTVDLTPGAQMTIPCSGPGQNGTCVVGTQSCSVARGVFDGGATGTDDAGPPPGADATVSIDSGTTGRASVSGSISGISVSPVDEAAMAGSLTGSYGQESMLGIIINDTAGVCGVQQQATGGGAQKASTTQVVLALATVSNVPIGPGTYSINSAGNFGPLTVTPGQTWAFGSITRTTPACVFQPNTVSSGFPDSQAIAGSINIAQVSSTSVSGSFSLTFPSGNLNGSFQGVPICNGINVQSSFTTTSPSAPGPDANGICYANIASSGSSDGGAGDASFGPPDASTDAPPPDAGPPPTDAGTSDAGGAGDGGAVSDSGGGGDASTAACYMLPPGAISWWRGEADPTDVFGNNAGTWWGPATYNPGEVGSAFDFAGVSYIAAGVAGVNAAAGGTIEAWVQPFTVPTGTPIDLVGFGTTTMVMDGGGLVVANGGSSMWVPEFIYSGQTLLGTPLNTYAWTHLALTWAPQVSDAGDAGDAGGIEDVVLYVNGTPIAAGPISFADAGTPTAFLMGGASAEPTGFTGMLDEVTLYSGPLSPAQVQGIYSAGPAGKCQCMTGADCPTTKPTCNPAHICQ
jgi:hypothetical protein